MLEFFECRGKWYLPENKDDEIDGILKYKKESGAILDLFGVFESHKSRHPIKIVLGETDKGLVTLIDSFYRTSKTNLRLGIKQSRYSPTIILKGYIFDSIEDILFRNLSFSLFNLHQWIDVTGITKNLDIRNSKFEINYSKPEDIEFSIQDRIKGRFDIDCLPDYENDSKRYEIKEETKVFLEYSSKTSLEVILKDINTFIGLVTLCTFEQSYPLYIYLKDDDYKELVFRNVHQTEIQCIFNHISYSSKYSYKESYDHLLKFKEIQSEFPIILEKWFKLNSENEPEVSLILRYFKNTNRIALGEFLDNIKACESLHRKILNNSLKSEDEYLKLVESVLTSVNLEDEENEWLKGRLVYGNEPSLLRRLKEMIKTCDNEFIKKRLPNRSERKKFCSKIKDTRNYHTHYDISLKDKALRGAKLANHTLILMGMNYSFLFNQLGIDPNAYEIQLLDILWEVLEKDEE